MKMEVNEVRQSASRGYVAKYLAEFMTNDSEMVDITISNTIPDQPCPKLYSLAKMAIAEGFIIALSAHKLGADVTIP